MKSQVSPAVFWVAICVVAVIAVFFGYKMLGSPSRKIVTTGSDATMEQYKKTGSFYSPPIPGAVPGGPSTNQMTPPMSGLPGPPGGTPGGR